MSAFSKRLILDNDAAAHAEGHWMEFYLTYEGALNASQRDARDGERTRHRENKREMRSHFHKQLRELWNVMPGLQESGKPKGSFIYMGDKGFEKPLTKRDELAAFHADYGFKFVPLVTEQLDLLCSLEILMLRPDRPGKTPWAGDIDNRLKTLLDALRIPEKAEFYTELTPTDDEEPMFVLLEDDKQITRVSVETDRLLEPINGRMDEVRLIIKVAIRPYELNMFNMHFG